MPKHHSFLIKFGKIHFFHSAAKSTGAYIIKITEQEEGLIIWPAHWLRSIAVLLNKFILHYKHKKLEDTPGYHSYILDS